MANENGPVDKFAQFLDRSKVALFGIGLGSLVFSWYMTYRMAKDIQGLKHELVRLKRGRPKYALSGRVAGRRKGTRHVLGYRRGRRP